MSRPFGIAGISLGSGGEIVFDSGLVMPPAITVNINSDVDDLLISDLPSGALVRFDNSGNNNLSGIVPSDITQGQLLFVANVGSGRLTIEDNNAGSSANNRFLCNGDKNLQSNEAMIMVYDTISLRWRVFAIIL